MTVSQAKRLKPHPARHLTHPAQPNLLAERLHDVIDLWFAGHPPAQYVRWLRAFRLRYLDLA